MKNKLFLALVLALAMVIIPVSSAFAETVTIYQPKVDYTNEDPITIVYKSCSLGTFANDIWNVTVIGAGVCTLTMTATNTGADPYTVNALITPNLVDGGTITATWNSASHQIAAGESYDFILTITSTTSVKPQKVNMDITFTR